MRVPIRLYDFDVAGQMWLRVRLAPLMPYISNLTFAFVAPPSVTIQLAPYNKISLMQIPILQRYLRQLLTVDLPAIMVLPRRLDIPSSPALGALADQVIGRDAVYEVSLEGGKKGTCEISGAKT